MIQLSADCLNFQLPDGESFPCSAEVASVELIGGSSGQVDPEVVQHAAEAVLHYFRHELGRETVSVGEFSEALQKVLIRLGFTSPSEVLAPNGPAQTDMRQLAAEAGPGFELAFFNRLREELRRHLAASPATVKFTGLKGSVKILLGARRWNASCRRLSDQIVAHLRLCWNAEGAAMGAALVVQ